jgi:hypothetical protein
MLKVVKLILFVDIKLHLPALFYNHETVSGSYRLVSGLGALKTSVLILLQLA